MGTLLCAFYLSKQQHPRKWSSECIPEKKRNAKYPYTSLFTEQVGTRLERPSLLADVVAAVQFFSSPVCETKHVGLNRRDRICSCSTYLHNILRLWCNGCCWFFFDCMPLDGMRNRYRYHTVV